MNEIFKGKINEISKIQIGMHITMLNEIVKGKIFESKIQTGRHTPLLNEIFKIQIGMHAPLLTSI